MTGWYDFSDVKSSKLLSFNSVAEADGLIYPRPFGENFSFAYFVEVKDNSGVNVIFIRILTF